MPTNVLALENGATLRSGARRGRCKTGQMAQMPEVRLKSGTTSIQGKQHLKPGASVSASYSFRQKGKPSHSSQQTPRADKCTEARKRTC